MIKISGLNKFFGHHHVLKNIDLEVNEGEKLVIIGPSGSGKSTLIRCINHLEEPTSGQVEIDGQLLTRKNKTQVVRNSSAMVFQQFNLYPHMTVLENLTLAPMKLQKMPKKEAEEMALQYLERVGLLEKKDAYPQNLSGGQQQRVAIGRAIISKPNILLADEPTGNLDSENTENIIHLLENLNRSTGQTIIMVTHDNELAKRCNKRVELSDGKIVKVSL